MKGRPLAAIVSAGLSKFGKLEGKYAREIFLDAAREAFCRCPDLNPKKDIKTLFLGQMSEGYERQGHLAPMCADWSGLLPIPSVRIENACASSGVALRLAIMALLSGTHDIVAVGGVEKMTARETSEATEYLAMASDYPMEQWSGMTFPAAYALMARRHMHQYGTTEQQLAQVAVKNHKHGLLNPKAHIRKAITVEEVMSSRPVATPLKLYDCSLITDGASILILTQPNLAKRFTDNPVFITGFGQANDTVALFEREDQASMKVVSLAAKQAYEMSDTKPGDIDVAETHDCFTIAEIMAYEELGFCKRGLGGRLVEENATTMGGQIPVNTSGGLKSKGHPTGATGTAQAYEIFLQLTGQAEQRQIQGAKVGLTCNVGGSGATGVVHIYRGK